MDRQPRSRVSRQLIPVTVLCIGLALSILSNRNPSAFSPHIDFPLVPRSQQERRFRRDVPLTIVATPGPFVGSKRLDQENALVAWMDAGISQVIYLDNSLNVERVVADYSPVVTHIPDLDKDQYGTPYLRSLFSSAISRSENDYMVYVNSDVFLLGRLGKVINCLETEKHRTLAGRPVLVVARRLDVRREPLGTFSDEGWKLRVNALLENGFYDAKHPCFIDVFLFDKRQGLFANLHPTMLGCTVYRWDNYLVDVAITSGILIDATAVLTPVHIHHHTRNYSPSFVRSQSLERQREHNRRVYPKEPISCIDAAHVRMVECDGGRYCLVDDQAGQSVPSRIDDGSGGGAT